MAAPRPHDLLLCDAAGLSAALPHWATPAWLARAPVVVRRESVADADVIAVGLRGLTRSLRHKAYLSLPAVTRCISPESLAASLDSNAWAGEFAHYAALQALADVAPLLFDTGLLWGPSGGVGFALASGLPVLGPGSDLDLVVRAPSPLTAAQQALLRRLCQSLRCRIDLQIDTGRGAFAFSEWARGSARVLLKTDDGPLLTDAPWRTESGAGSGADAGIAR
jgi:phosphoribosyl-dephospho-CoA transferase